MTSQLFRAGNGCNVRLGRVPIHKAFNVGRFRYTEYANGSKALAPRFGAHLNPRLGGLATLSVTTNWLAKCLPAIAQMYGNDTKGDCVIASLLKLVGAWTGNESGTPALSNTAEALQEYVTICGPGDQGCVITDVLTYAKTHGVAVAGVNHKIAGWASVNPQDQNEVQVCTEVFGPSIKLGINLPQAWMDAATGNGFVWDVASGSIGGHDVPIIDVTPKGPVIATWGLWGTITWAAMAKASIVEEAEVSLSPDWYAKGNLAPNGIDAGTLSADLKLVQGGTIPPIGPTPPAPVPPGPVPPSPTPVPSGPTEQQVQAAVDQFFASAEARLPRSYRLLLETLRQGVDQAIKRAFATSERMSAAAWQDWAKWVLELLTFIGTQPPPLG